MSDPIHIYQATHLAAIHALESAYDAAWDASDLDALEKLFSPDAVVVNPRGEVAVGRTDIRQALERFLGGAAKGSTHRSTLTGVRLITQDVAVVDGEAVIEGLRDPNGSTASALRHRFTDIVVRREEVWKISDVRAYA